MSGIYRGYSPSNIGAPLVRPIPIRPVTPPGRYTGYPGSSYGEETRTRSYSLGAVPSRPMRLSDFSLHVSPPGTPAFRQPSPGTLPFIHPPPYVPDGIHGPRIAPTRAVRQSYSSSSYQPPNRGRVGTPPPDTRMPFGRRRMDWPMEASPALPLAARSTARDAEAASRRAEDLEFVAFSNAQRAAAAARREPGYSARSPPPPPPYTPRLLPAAPAATPSQPRPSLPPSRLETSNIAPSPTRSALHSARAPSSTSRPPTQPARPPSSPSAPAPIRNPSPTPPRPSTPTPHRPFTRPAPPPQSSFRPPTPPTLPEPRRPASPIRRPSPPPTAPTSRAPPSPLQCPQPLASTSRASSSTFQRREPIASTSQLPSSPLHRPQPIAATSRAPNPPLQRPQPTPSTSRRPPSPIRQPTPPPPVLALSAPNPRSTPVPLSVPNPRRRPIIPLNPPDFATGLTLTRTGRYRLTTCYAWLRAMDGFLACAGFQIEFQTQTMEVENVRRLRRDPRLVAQVQRFMNVFPVFINYTQELRETIQAGWVLTNEVLLAKDHTAILGLERAEERFKKKCSEAVVMTAALTEVLRGPAEFYRTLYEKGKAARDRGDLEIWESMTPAIAQLAERFDYVMLQCRELGEAWSVESYKEYDPELVTTGRRDVVELRLACWKEFEQENGKLEDALHDAGEAQLDFSKKHGVLGYADETRLWNELKATLPVDQFGRPILRGTNRRSTPGGSTGYEGRGTYPHAILRRPSPPGAFDRQTGEGRPPSPFSAADNHPPMRRRLSTTFLNRN